MPGAKLKGDCMMLSTRPAAPAGCQQKNRFDGWHACTEIVCTCCRAARQEVPKLLKRCVPNAFVCTRVGDDIVVGRIWHWISNLRRNRA